ncbi:uncharacterized protein TRIADDRAFT_52873 [Trichoplax adhaerens]|uniref:APAF-1 helical domain-containing protein n=1 Tax=Trichoplax adhaerens TaxID=10228 RepID=B3RMP2_TRIAD|nr:predicted protein [Trichoplax adhaerens]EDV27308.1 predicted protein [Trichoplax adhaerens]|eukprot:XP_002109142.1 predicted protein [Trichoplax adhaerens]
MATHKNIRSTIQYFHDNDAFCKIIPIEHLLSRLVMNKIILKKHAARIKRKNCRQEKNQLFCQILRKERNETNFMTFCDLLCCEYDRNVAEIGRTLHDMASSPACWKEDSYQNFSLDSCIKPLADLNLTSFNSPQYHALKMQHDSSGARLPIGYVANIKVEELIAIQNREVKNRIQSLDLFYQNPFIKLGVFLRATGIPVTLIMVLWQQDFIFSMDILQYLAKVGLLTLSKKNERNCCNIDEDAFKYVQNIQSYKPDCHSLLLDELELQCHGNWHELPNDGYIYHYLVNHEIAANKFKSVKSLITNLRWLDCKVNAHHNLSVILEDFVNIRDKISAQDWQEIIPFYQFLIRYQGSLAKIRAKYCTRTITADNIERIMTFSCCNPKLGPFRMVVTNMTDRYTQIVMNVETGTKLFVTSSVCIVKISSDGKMIAYADNLKLWQVWHIDCNTGMKFITVDGIRDNHQCNEMEFPVSNNSLIASWHNNYISIWKIDQHKLYISMTKKWRALSHSTVQVCQFVNNDNSILVWGHYSRAYQPNKLACYANYDNIKSQLTGNYFKCSKIEFCVWKLGKELVTDETRLTIRFKHLNQFNKRSLRGCFHVLNHRFFLLDCIVGKDSSHQFYHSLYLKATKHSDIDLTGEIDTLYYQMQPRFFNTIYLSQDRQSIAEVVEDRIQIFTVNEDQILAYGIIYCHTNLKHESKYHLTFVHNMDQVMLSYEQRIYIFDVQKRNTHSAYDDEDKIKIICASSAFVDDAAVLVQVISKQSIYFLQTYEGESLKLTNQVTLDINSHDPENVSCELLADCNSIVIMHDFPDCEHNQFGIRTHKLDLMKKHLSITLTKIGNLETDLLYYPMLSYDISCVSAIAICKLNFQETKTSCTFFHYIVYQEDFRTWHVDIERKVYDKNGNIIFQVMKGKYCFPKSRKEHGNKSWISHKEYIIIGKKNQLELYDFIQEKYLPVIKSAQIGIPLSIQFGNSKRMIVYNDAKVFLYITLLKETE